ncbi:MAG TPA: ABC transporter permease, partial [Candidatus Methanomethylicus sp.]|nr:ABC transporter permease [Candidatus Methanomethylicus sp.]
MKASDTLGWGIRGIRQRKLRAVLTILGIMIGVASVVALVSQTQGIQYSIIDQVNKLGPTSININTRSTSIILTQSDVDRISQMPGVDYVIPIVTSTIRVYGTGPAKTFTLIGVDPAQWELLIEDTSLEEGHMFQAMSYSEAVIGYGVHYPQDLSVAYLNVGQSVTAEVGLVNPVRKQLQIVGALDAYGATSAVSVDDTIFMPLKGAMSILGTTSYTQLIVKATDVDSVDSVVNTIRASYGRQLSIITVKQITQIVSTITDQLTLLLGAIAAISLLVAGLGIMNIMFVSVIERTREIGVLKALGFKGKNVMRIFLSEAAIMGVIGGILGVAAGTAMSY